MDHRYPSMKSFFKAIAKAILLVIGLAFFYINFSLYAKTAFQKENFGSYNLDVVHQLHFLRTKIDEGEAVKMQSLFPEGFVFFHAIYGLSWGDLIANQSDTSAIYRQGLKEISQSLDAIFSPEGKRTFSKNLPLEYGAYYRGWSNYLLAQKIALTKSLDRDSSEIHRYLQNCIAISAAIDQSKSPYLESYNNNCWPADMLVAVSSLQLANEITDTSFDTTIQSWLEKTKKHLDSSGLIPHSTQVDGTIIEPARGSSQALILRFLVDIDKDFAFEQYETFKEIFTQSRLGLKAVREYSKDATNDNGDVDSGPIIWDIGTVATIVSQGTFGKFNDWNRYQETKNCLNILGLGHTSGAEKKYLLGMYPMADVFLAWSNAMEPVDLETKVNGNWRWKFQIFSFLMLTIAALIFIGIARYDYKK